MMTSPERCHQQFQMKQEPKCINGGILGTLGHPKGRKPYGGGNLVRRLGFRCFSSVAGISDNSCGGLKELMEVNIFYLFS
jgi:hypothetical protein